LTIRWLDIRSESFSTFLLKDLLWHSSVVNDCHLLKMLIFIFIKKIKKYKNICNICKIIVFFFFIRTSSESYMYNISYAMQWKNLKLLLVKMLIIFIYPTPLPLTIISNHCTVSAGLRYTNITVIQVEFNQMLKNKTKIIQTILSINTSKYIHMRIYIQIRDMCVADKTTATWEKGRSEFFWYPRMAPLPMTAVCQIIVENRFRRITARRLANFSTTSKGAQHTSLGRVFPK
jgi:hypothetical protein